MRVSYFAFQKTGNSSEFVTKSSQHFPLDNGRQSLELYITQYNLCVQACTMPHTHILQEIRNSQFMYSHR